MDLYEKSSYSSQKKPEFERRGYGFLNPFRRYFRKCDEEVDIDLVR